MSYMFMMKALVPPNHYINIHACLAYIIFDRFAIILHMYMYLL